MIEGIAQFALENTFMCLQIDITFWALGDLQKAKSSEARANLLQNGFLQLPQ